MGVRVKVEVKTIGNPTGIEASALLNSGFESESPEILIPTRVANILGFLPNLPNEASVGAFETVGGTVRMCFIKNAVKVRVVTEDKKTNFILCTLVISESEREVILSDHAFSKLGISIENAAKGTWKFAKETKMRKTTEPQYW